MEPVPGSIVDEAKYRQNVLGLPSAEVEEAQAQHLINEAEQLGLKVPKVEGSLLEPISSSPAPDPVISSLSDTTIFSDHLSPGSALSPASRSRSRSRSTSTRPTSFCASERKAPNTGCEDNNDLAETKSTRHSILSVSSTDKKEKSRGGFIAAIGRMYFRKKRPSPDRVPPETQKTGSKGAKGRDPTDQKPTSVPHDSDHESEPPHDQTETALPNVELPLYTKETVQRSMNDPGLNKMHERHKMERSRHLAFQDAALGTLRRRHQTALSEKESDSRRKEEEKREKNTEDVLQLEERQLEIEIEKQCEFERAKANSHTRIKHMEGYFRNISPPSSPAAQPAKDELSSESLSETDSAQSARVLTRRHMQQLEQQYLDHEAMDQLHNSRIKVLRERQALKLQAAVKRTEKELDAMREQHIQELDTLHTEQRQEEISLTEALDVKKATLRQRWCLEEVVLRRRLEVRHGQLYGPLPPLSFTNSSVPSVPGTPTLPGSPFLESFGTLDTIYSKHYNMSL